jgi:hypothetical protein
VLVRNFPALEFHHYDVRKLDALAGGRDSRQQIIPLCVVSEAHDKFVHHLVFANGAGDGCHLRIFGDLVYEVLTVKAADALGAEAARHARNAVHVGFRDHGFHGAVEAQKTETFPVDHLNVVVGRSGIEDNTRIT